MPYTAPDFKKSAFNCPHCGAFAEMTWAQEKFTMFNSWRMTPIRVSYCSHIADDLPIGRRLRILKVLIL